MTLDSLLNVKISTATKYEQTISEAPASVSIITSEDIELYGYRTLDEILTSLRGFYTSYDRNYSYVGIRGFGRPTDYNDRILLLINGHTMNENVYGSAFIGTDLPISLNAVERIEIVRGPGSALYGTGAMFAVINIITKRGNSLDGIKLSAETGSYGRLKGALVGGKEFENGLDLVVSGLWSDINGHDAYFQEYDTPATNNGIAQNLDWDKSYGFLATLMYKGFTLSGNITSREKGIPTGSFSMKFNDNHAKTLDERKSLELKFTDGLGADKNITWRGYIDHYGYEGTSPYNILSYDASDGNWWGTELQFRWDIVTNNRLTIGAEYKKNYRADYRLWDMNTIFFNNNFPFNLFSIYLQDEYQLMENLLLTLGIRFDEYSTVGSSTTPRGALVFNPTQSGTLKLLYGEGFRAPNVNEVNYQEPIAGYKTNPRLRAEKIRTIEAIWEQRLSDELFGSVSLYNYSMKDLIDQMIDPTDSLKQYQNVRKVRANGVEVELNARLAMRLSGYANYAYQHVKDVGSNLRLSNSPSHLLRVGLAYPIGVYLHTAIELQYDAQRTTVYGTTTNPYLLANLNISGKPLLSGFAFSLLVRNVFNTTYKTPGGLEHKQPGITQDGRNFTITFEYSF